MNNGSLEYMSSLLCPEDGDTPSHLFFECSNAQEVWDSMGLLQKVLQARVRRGDTWFRNLLKDSDDEFRELLIMSCDDIWFQRNHQIFEDSHRPAREMAATVVSSLRRFKEAQGWHDLSSAALLPGHLLRPPDGVNRFYFDAGISQNSAAVGVCMVDSEGTFVRALSRRIANVQDPILAEALALEEAILFAGNGDGDGVAFIGDALHMISMVRGDVESTEFCRPIISRIRSLLDPSFPTGPFWVPRDSNFVAHALANFAKTSTLEQNTWVSPPSFLSLDSGRISGP